MKFDKARNLVKLLLAMCIVFGIVSIAVNGTDSVMALYAPILSFVFFVLAFVVIFLYCRCPNCGKRVYLGLFKAMNCPRCRRNLITGEKSKGKKR